MISFDDVEAAAAAIAGHLRPTPMLHSPALSALAGAEVFLKLETLQITGSFKERGAFNYMGRLDEAARARGVVACSAGNHAQGVARAGHRLGIPVTVVMPKDTPFLKVQRTAQWGARVVLHGANLSEAEDRACALASERDLTVVHPYDDPAIIAGQGTVALEMLSARPDLDALVLPVGGGGLSSGCAIAAKALRPDIALFGVQAAFYPAMAEAVADRMLPEAVDGPTLAEGIAVKRPGALTVPILKALLDAVLLVEEPAIERAVQLIAENEKLLVEGAGAAPLAAVLGAPERFRGQRVGLVLSGGNIDSRLLAAVLMRGLVREGKLARIRVPVDDRPGNLARVTAAIAGLGGNILEVAHQRWFETRPAKMAELEVTLETRDAAHLQTLIEGLREAGFVPEAMDGAPAPV